MNLRSGLLMAILLIAGSAYIYRTEFVDQVPPSNPAEVVVLPGADAQSIQWMEVSNTSGSIQLEREGFSPRTVRGDTAFKSKKEGEPRWVLSVPPGAPTNSTTVESILNGVAALKSKSIIEESEVGDLAAYGLAKPETSLEVAGAFGKRKINFGKQSTISKRRYLAVDGEKRVLMVDESLYSLLTQPINKIRNEHPIKFDAAIVKTLSVRRSSSGDTVEFKKAEEGWTATIGDKTVLADPTEIEQALAQLGSLTVTHFVDEPEGPIALYGLKEPRAVISVRFSVPTDASDPADLIFYLGEGVSIKPKTEDDPESNLGVSAKKAVFAKLVGDPTIYELKGAPLSYFTRVLADLRDKEPLRSVKSSDVVSATVGLSGKPPFVLERTEGNWISIDGSTSAAIDQERAQAWFASVVASRVLSYQESKPLPDAGFDDYIQLKLADGSDIKISFGKELTAGTHKKDAKPEDRPRWVKFDIRNSNNGVAVLPAQKVADILRGRDFFKGL